MAKLPMVMAVLNDISNVSASTVANASVSRLPTPTSEPSKYRLQVTPSKRRISSSAKETPPTLPLLANEAKKGSAEAGVVVAVGVFVGVRVGVLVAVGVGVAVRETSHTLPSFSLGLLPLSTPRLAM